MTEKNKVYGNDLIKQFLYYFPNRKQIDSKYYSESKFDNDYNFQLFALEFIENNIFFTSIEIRRFDCSIYSIFKGYNILIEKTEISKKLSIFKAIVCFVEWYNLLKDLDGVRGKSMLLASEV